MTPARNTKTNPAVGDERARSLIALIDGLIEIVNEENVELAKGLPASRLKHVDEKNRLATLFEQSVAEAVGKAASLRASVRYANDPALGLWLPSEMSQQVEVTGTGSGEPTVMGAGGGYATRRSLEGRASYTKFRRTPVDLTKIQ